MTSLTKIHEAPKLLSLLMFAIPLYLAVMRNVFFIYFILFLRIFTQDNLFNFDKTVIKEGPVMEVLTTFKDPI